MWTEVVLMSREQNFVSKTIKSKLFRFAVAEVHFQRKRAWQQTPSFLSNAPERPPSEFDWFVLIKTKAFCLFDVVLRAAKIIFLPTPLMSTAWLMSYVIFNVLFIFKCRIMSVMTEICQTRLVYFIVIFSEFSRLEALFYFNRLFPVNSSFKMRSHWKVEIASHNQEERGQTMPQVSRVIDHLRIEVTHAWLIWTRKKGGGQERRREERK